MQTRAKATAFAFSLFCAMEKHAPEAVWAYFKRLQNYDVLRQLFAALGESNIPAIAIKGIAAWRWYPESLFRPSNDFDLCFRHAEVDQAKILLKDLEALNFNVDIHDELRHLDTVPWETLYARCDAIDVEGIAVRVPCAEDNLRIMAVHWLNDGGQFRERLWDIYYAVENRPETFDWSECLDVVSPTRRKWVITAIGLAHRYLDLNIDDLPFAGEAKQIPNWIIRTIEKEWETDVRLIPLHTVVRQPRLFMQQLKKRFPPNPIQATIEAEGEFDDRSRVYYQLRSAFSRLVPSLRRIVPVLRRRQVT